QRRLAVHPLDLRRGLVKDANGPTADRAAAVTRDQKGAAAALDLLSLEVRTEALLGRIEGAKLAVECGDQPAGVRGVERLGRHGQVRVAHPSHNLRAADRNQRGGIVTITLPFL